MIERATFQLIAPHLADFQMKKIVKASRANAYVSLPVRSD